VLAVLLLGVVPDRVVGIARAGRILGPAVTVSPQTARTELR